MLDLFNDLGAGLARVVLRNDGAEAVDVQGVLLAQLVLGAADEFELIKGNADGLEHAFDGVFVVLGAELEQIPGCLEERGNLSDFAEGSFRCGCISIEFGPADYLHVVQVCVKVGEQNGDLASGGEKVSDLGHGDEIRDMRLA